MPDIVVQQTPVVDAAGNIQVNRQGSVTLSFLFADADNEPRDVSALDLRFITKTLDIALSAGDSENQRFLEIDQDALDLVTDGLTAPVVTEAYVVVDKTDADLPEVHFEGKLIVRTTVTA